MPFRVVTNGTGADEIIVLENLTNGTKAEIYRFGALLNAFWVKHNGADLNVIFGFKNPADAQHNITPLFQSAKLSPFVCRLKEGQYTFANEKHKIEKYYSNREAIHGLVYDALYSIKDKSDGESASVTLTYDYDKRDHGYPFFYTIDITYTLQNDNCLTIATKVVNQSAVAIPMSDGWHPYFQLGKKVNELTLFMNTTEMVEFDHRLLPTRNLLPYTEFFEPKPVGDAKLDNCFVVQNDSRPACILADPSSNIQINITPHKGYPFLQVFIPDHRNSIAIENLSSLPDSFNNAVGLIILEPREEHEFITTYQVQKTTALNSSL